MSEIEQAWERAVKTVPIVRGRRKVKVAGADGTVREVDAADVLASLIERQGLETVVREGVLPVEIQRRRAQGLPDLCASCGKELSMCASSLKRRGNCPERWACVGCNIRKAKALMTPEERSAATRKRLETLTPERRSAARRKGVESMTPEQRSSASRKANARRTTEQKSAAGRKAKASMTPEQLSAASRNAKASMGQDLRSAATRKAWATRRAKAAQ